MMRKHRVWSTSAAVSAALMTVAAAGCGSSTNSSPSGSSSGKAIQIGYVPKLTGVAVFDEANRCMKLQAAKENASVTYTAPASADAQGQVNIFNSLIARKYNVIITSADDPATLAPTLERAMKQGIKVISWDSDVIPAARDLFVANADDHQVAREEVDQLVHELGGGSPKADIAFLSSTPTATAQLTWIKLMRQYIAQKYPGLRIVTTEYGYSDLGKSLTAAENLLHSYPNVKGIIAPDALAVPGAAQAIQKLGLKGRVALTGLTDPKSIKPYIDNGIVKKVFLWDYCRAGKLLAQLARVAANNQLPKQVPATISTPLGAQHIDSNSTLPSGPLLAITQANVANYSW